MAVDFGLFRLSAPPRTGLGWVIPALAHCGIKPLGGTNYPFTPPARDTSRITVSLVRHPCTWLESFHENCRGKFFEHKPLREIADVGGESPDEFARTIALVDPGAVWKLYQSYNADVCLKVEDMPWCLTTLLESLGVEDEKLLAIKHFGKTTWRPARTTNLSASVWREVYRSEISVLEHFGYC